MEMGFNRSSDDNQEALCYDQDVTIVASCTKTGKERMPQMESHTRVLIVDDQRPVREGLRCLLALLPLLSSI